MISPAADDHIGPGQLVLVWREKHVEHRVGEWLGPCTVVSVERDKTLVYICESDDATANIVRLSSGSLLVHSLHRLRDLSIIVALLLETIYVTEIIDKDDPRANSPEMCQTRREKIKGLLDCGTFKVFCAKNYRTGLSSALLSSY